MSTFTFNNYLVDENGDYVLSDPLDPTSRIILSTSSVTVDAAWRAVGGQLGRRIPPVFSFWIKQDYVGGWYLVVNRQHFVGRYPTQSACVSVLYGIMTSHSGLDDSFSVWLEESLNTRGSELDSDIPLDYVYGRTSILADLVDSKAHVMVIGDSISNDSAAGFATWPQGMAAHWRPVAWESAFISSGTGGGTAIGTKLIISAGASAVATDYSQDVKPGAITTAVTNSGLAGHHPRIGSMQLIKDNWNEGQTYRQTLVPSVLYYDGDTIPATIGKKLYQNLDGSYNFYTGADVTASCFVTSRGDGVLAPDGEGYIPGITVRWYYDGSYDFVAGDTTVDFTAGTPPTGLYTWDVETQQLSLPDWNVGDVQVFFKGPTGIGWPAGGGWHATSGGFLNKAGVTDGMRVAYMGQGGWETKNHALEYGDPNVPIVEGTYYGSYTDAGLEDFIRVTDSNVFFLYIGQNDDISDNDDIAQGNVDIITRIRAACANVGVVNPKFIIVMTSCVSPSTAVYANQRAAAATLAAWAPTQTDVVFCDLQEYLETLFDFSDVSVSNVWRDSYTVDGTHPTAAGMEIMSKDFLWAKVLEASGAVESPNNPPTLTATGDQLPDSLSEGDTASVTALGGGSPSPTVTYQWQRGGADIVGATASSYQTGNDDGGTVLTCVVTASNGTNPDAVKVVNFGTVAGVINYIVYDTFGSGGNLTGRTPDTVNNGNTWVRVGTGELTATGGYCWNNAGDNGTGISVIDVGTNTVTIDAASKISSTGVASTTINGDLMHTIVLNRDGAAFERIGLSSNASIVYQHWNGSGYTTNTTIRTLPTPVSYGDTLQWIFTKTATSCDWEVYVNGNLEQSDTGRALALNTTFVGVQVRNDEPENVDETTATAWAYIGVY